EVRLEGPDEGASAAAGTDAVAASAAGAAAAALAGADLHTEAAAGAVALAVLVLTPVGRVALHILPVVLGDRLRHRLRHRLRAALRPALRTCLLGARRKRLARGLRERERHRLRVSDPRGLDRGVVLQGAERGLHVALADEADAGVGIDRDR